MTGRMEAVSEILAAGIVTSDDDTAQIISNVAELVATGLTADQIQDAKIRALSLVLALRESETA